MDKKVFCLFFICFIGLFTVSLVNAADEVELNNTLLLDSYHVSDELSNENIQSVLDNAKDGDTIEFNSKEYKNICLVVDKRLNIVSKVNSVFHVSSEASNKVKSLGIDQPSGFYFTSNSQGSILSGITIIANSADHGVVLDSSNNTVIKNNVIIGGVNSVLIKDSNNVNLIYNSISKASKNGVQLQNVGNSLIYNNKISYNGRSGIETSNINNNNISHNTIHHNGFNGISMYNTSSSNLIKHNNVYENTNGIYIDSKSNHDVINANSFTSNRRDPNCELGGYESGNGLLFGSNFKTAKEGSNARLKVKYNVLAHNEQYQAKNNPELPIFKLGDNWFDSNDDANTFVCPMLLAGIMKLDTISVKNGIGLQMYDTNGNEVKEFATFDTKVNIDGNQYTAKFVNGKAIIDVKLDPNKEYEVEVEIGGQLIKYKYKVATGEKSNNDVSKTKNKTNKNSGTSNPNSGSSNSNVSKKRTGNSSLENNHISNSNDQSKKYGSNSSDIYSSDSSDNGQNAISNGDSYADELTNDEESSEGKAYEVVPESKISKSLTETSGVVVIIMIFLIILFIYGYRRGNND